MPNRAPCPAEAGRRGRGTSARGPAVDPVGGMPRTDFGLAVDSRVAGGPPTQAVRRSDSWGGLASANAPDPGGSAPAAITVAGG